MITGLRKAENRSYTAVIMSLIFCIGCNNIGAGSYPYAEIYTLPFSEHTVIRAIDTFKSMHLKAVAPVEDLRDGRGGSDGGYWYHTYFYLPEEQTIVHCWTRPESKTKTKFAIVGLNSGLELGNWKEVNKDFSSRENEAVIKKIENTFLNPIEAIIRKQNGL